MVPAELRSHTTHALHYQKRLTLLPPLFFVAAKGQVWRFSKRFSSSTVMPKTEIQNFKYGKNKVSEPLAARSFKTRVRHTTSVSFPGDIGNFYVRNMDYSNVTWRNI